MPIDNTNSANGGKSPRFMVRRLKQVLWATQIGLVISLFTNIAMGENHSSSFFIGIAAVVMISAFYFVKKEQYKLSVAILLWTLTISLTLLMAANAGLRDPAIFAYPGILIYAAMLGTKRLFLSILAFMVTAVTTVGTMNELGIMYNDFPRHNANVIIDVLVILLVIAFTIRILGNDMSNLLSKLRHENMKVKESEREIAHIAHHDGLTGLPNRVLCRDRFQHAILQCARQRKKLAILFIDLDNFKSINDSMGYQFGDEILVAMGKRLTSCLRKEDTVSRHGGDEFLVILEGIQGNESVSKICINIMEQISIPFSIQNEPVTITCSIGISIAPDDADDFDVVSKNADMAMYRAKEDGRNTYCFYDLDMQENTNQYFETAKGLREASIKNQFQVQYQPIVDLKTGKFKAAEALVRWKHPVLGTISPATFIPIAESTGQIIEIGAWVIHEACKDLKAWHDLGFTDMSMAINLSFVQFRRGNLQETVESSIAAFKLSPEFIDLELTESLLFEDRHNVKKQLRDMKSKGIHFSIDDFGTGYSNLSYLSKFDVETLKIDRTFTKDMVTDSANKAIVEAIIQIAKSLHLHTVAEGVEDIETLEALAELHCDKAQGYYWSKPVVASEFIEKLRSNRENFNSGIKKTNQNN